MPKTDLKNMMAEFAAFQAFKAAAGAGATPKAPAAAAKGAAAAAVEVHTEVRNWTAAGNDVSKRGWPTAAFSTATSKGGTWTCTIPKDLADALRAGLL